MGVQLFDRNGRYARLTEEGTALLAQARLVVSGMDGFQSRARAIADGLEPELSVVEDIMYPMASLTDAVGAFRKEFPHTPPRLYVEALGAVMQPVLGLACRLGISGSMPAVPEVLEAEKLLDVPMITVAAPSHPLVSHKELIRPRDLKDHVQLALTDRTRLTEGTTFGVSSPQIWRLADLGAKHAFLRAGFGWGHMSVAMVQADLDARTLVPLRIEAFQPHTPPIAMFAVYRKDTPPGPAGRWFLKRLKGARGTSER